MSTYIDDEIARADDIFVAKATHSVRRAAEIAVLTKKKKKMYWIKYGLAALCFIYPMFVSDRNNNMVILILLIWGIFWMLYFKIESDLRLLRIIDHIQKDEKPVA